MSLGAAAGDAGTTTGTANTGTQTTDGTGGSTGGTSTGGNTGATGGASGGTSLGTSGGESKSWRDSLPDDLKADPTLSKYSDLPNLAKAHIELQKKFGQKGVFKPGKDASPEEIKAFREQMGIPTDPTKYDLGTFEGVEVQPELVDWAKKMGTEHGIEPAALKAVMTDYMQTEARTEAAIEAMAIEDQKAGIEGLRTEWGEAFRQNLDKANFAAKRLGGDALLARLKEFGADNDPLIIKAFVEASKLYGEDKLKEGGVSNGRSSPAELDNEIKEVQGRLFSMKATDGAYPGVKARYESLWRQKTGGR